MDWVAIGAGMLLTGVVGYLFGERGRRNGELTERETVREIHDMYDKMRHLYDRARHRIQGEPVASSDTPTLDPKAALRAEARAKGLLR